MHALRLLGVSDDGTHLVLGDGASEYALPIDAALRAALRRDGGHVIPGHTDDRPMSPVEVQALIRGGADAQEAADRAGWSVEKVRRYEGPILAEREHVARLALGARLRPRGPASGSPTLLDRVTRRLAERGVSVEDVDWDSWRDDGGRWVLELDYTLGGGRRRASWSFEKSAMSIRALDPEAAQLTDDDPDPGPSPLLPTTHPGYTGQSAHDPGQEIEEVGYEEAAYAVPPALDTGHGDRGHGDGETDLMDALRSTSRARRRGGRRAPQSATPGVQAEALLPEDVAGNLAPTPPEAPEVSTAATAATAATTLEGSIASPSEAEPGRDPEEAPSALADLTAAAASLEAEAAAVTDAAANHTPSRHDAAGHDAAGPEASREETGAEATASTASADTTAPEPEGSPNGPGNGGDTFPPDPDAPTPEEPHLPLETGAASADDRRGDRTRPEPSPSPSPSPSSRRTRRRTTTTSSDGSRTRRTTSQTPPDPASAASPAEAPVPDPGAPTKASRRPRTSGTARPDPGAPVAPGTPVTSPSPTAGEGAPTPEAQSAPSSASSPSSTSSSRRRTPRGGRRGRASVPAWDDIMFGAKPGEE